MGWSRVKIDILGEVAEWFKAQHWKCCISCAVKIISGTLQQPEAMGVSQALKDKGYALLCVAKATSDLEVETTYEDEVYDLQFGQYFGRGNTRVAPPWEFEED